MMKRARPCEICGGGDTVPIYHREFEQLPNALLRSYDVVSCQTCGFCFAENLPTPLEFERYYELQSKYEFHHRGGAASEYDARRLPAAASLISEWLPDKQSRILDVGCANGGLLDAIRTQGFPYVMGADPSPTCAEAARRLYDIEVLAAPLTGIPSSIGRFDLVIFGSVMEHLLDLNGTVKRVADLLTPRGCVFIEVPDMTRCTELDDAPFQEFSVEHINFFSPTSLANLWGKHGFDRVALKQTEIDYVSGLKAFEIKALFRAGAGPARSPAFDATASAELVRYVGKSRGKLSRLDVIFGELAKSRTPVIVWGVGTHTQSLLVTTSLKDVNIAAFVDSNARYVGQELHGIPILSPAVLSRRPEAILVSSQQFQAEIVEEIKMIRRLPNEVITLY